MEEIKPRSLDGCKTSRAQTRCLGFFILVKFFKKINFFKITSAFVAVIFFWNQIVWAGDIAVNALDNLNDSQAQTFAPDYLQKQETLHEDIVDQKQAIEEFGINQAALTTSGNIEPPQEETLDLKGPIGSSSGQVVINNTSYVQSSEDGGVPAVPSDDAILSITTQEGDVIHYRGSSIDYIERQDGSILRDLYFGVDGGLLEAEITYPDGTLLIVTNSKVSTITKPDGTIFSYNDDEKIDSILYPDGKTVTFSYGVVDTDDGNLVTVITDPEKILYYDADNRLKKVVFNDGKIIEYTGGVISKITEADLSLYIFDIKTNLDGTPTSNIARYIAPDGTIYKYTVDEGGVLTAVTVEKNGVVAAYNKEGALVAVTKDGGTITAETIIHAQADYDAAVALYRQKQQEAITCQTNLNNTSSALAVKTTAKDIAVTDLNNSIQDLNNAQAIKDTKQTAYDAAYNDYLAAQVSYWSAYTALNDAKALEAQAFQDRTNTQSTLVTKRTILNNTIAARQAVQATITNFNNQILADQTSLTKAQQDLSQALADESAARSDYNNAQDDVNAKQAAYDDAAQGIQAKEAIFNAAAANLTIAQQAKTSAENALSSGTYVVSSYAYLPASTVLNQYKSFINDQFNSYDPSVWHKPADTLATIGSGSAILKGTGINYNALLYTNQSYNRVDKPTLSTTFKVSSTSGKFVAALDGYTQTGTYRRVGIYVYSGRIYLQTVAGSTTSNKATLISSAKVNTNYNLEFEVTGQNIKVYLWASTAQKPVNPSYTYTTTDWNAIRPYYSVYSGTATIDYTALKGPNYNSTYDSTSQLVKDTYQNGSVSVYSYSADKITVSDYKKYLDSPYTLSTQGLWYKPADSLVAISSGIATLKGTGSNYNATFYSNQSFTRANDVVVRSDFKVTSTSGKFIAAVDGYTSSRAYRRVGVIMQSGRIYVQTVSGFGTSMPKILVSTAKANTNYTIELQIKAQSINIYLWESSGSRPISPSYAYTVTDWTAARPYYSIYSGAATVSNVSINYASQVRTINQGSTEWNQISARNQLVKNLNSTNIGVSTAQTAYDLANTDLNNAKSLEAQTGQDLAIAQNTLAAKQVTLNNKAIAIQAIQTAINNLNAEIASLKTQLAQTQYDLNGALNEEAAAQSEYNQALADFTAKQIAYNDAVQDRIAKSSAFSVATDTLVLKNAIKDQDNTELQDAIRSLSDAQAAKDTKLIAANSALMAYFMVKTAYDKAVADLNNAKGAEAAAKVSVDSRFAELNTLLSVSSIFPQEDAVLKTANNRLEVLLNTLHIYDLNFLNNMSETMASRDEIKQIYEEYGDIDSLGLNSVTRIVYGDGRSEAFEYYGDTSIVFRHSFTDPSGVWQKTVEYYEDGKTMNFQWIADANPGTAGDVIFIQYDSDGMAFTKKLDSGAISDYTMASYYADWQYLSSSFRVATNPSGEIATFKYINGKWLVNSFSLNDALVSWGYDVSGNVTGRTKTLSDGTAKVYDAGNKLTEKRVPDSNFMQGVNLPWINYGYDMGGGITGNLPTLYTQLDKWKGSIVRIFLFADLRSGINFDASGNPLSFKTGVTNDMNALLAAAKAFDIKLIPVLFDYMIADGKSGSFIGEHPDLITDASKKQKLLSLFGTFFDIYAGNNSVYAWDIMNEPEFAGAVAISDTQSFISDFTDLIHSKSSQAKVTVGSARRDWMLKYWTGMGLDIYQYHYYDNFESSLPLNYSVDSLGLDKPVIVGELQPTQVLSKLGTVKTSGYSAGLFWQDQSGYTIGPVDYTTIRDYFSGSRATYSYYTSGRIKAETWTNGASREFEDLAFYKDGTGRLTKETFSDNSYIVYTYYDNAFIIKSVTSFLASGILVMKKDYDSTGALTTITSYNDNGSIRKKSSFDGTYQIFDQSGNILEQATETGGTISARDNQNKLLREVLKDGTIKEYSSDLKLLRVLRPDGISTEYHYNADGSILDRNEYSADGSFTIYDAQGNAVYTYIYKSADLETSQDGPDLLSLTTALGDVIKYKNDKMVSITRETDKAFITAIELDVSGNLKNAHVVHADGSVDIVRNNSIIETIFSDGTISRYRDNRKAFDYSKAIGYTRYYYTEDVNHNVISITTINKNAVCSYDANGLPIRFEKSDGSITEYDSGYLKRITDSNGRRYLYTITTGSNSSSTLTTAITGDSIPVKVLYDASKNITSTVLADGTTLSSANGILQGITGLDSKINIDAGGTFSFDNGSYKTYYDEKGGLKKITTLDNTDVYFNNGQISEIQSEDGTRVLYTGGRIAELYDKKEGAIYESDSQGRITKVTYDNGAVFVYHYDAPLTDGSVKVTIAKENDSANITVRIYDKDGLLIEQVSPSGIISKYAYETSGDRRILTISQTKNGVIIGSYSYQYLADKTLVTDITQNKKEYGTNGNIKFMYTPEGYVYEYHMTENSTLVSELTRWDKGSGITIYYSSGDVDRVETIGADGKMTVLKEAVFDSDGKLKSFTVILPTGESRRCTVYDNGWSEINTSDAKLIYKDDPVTGNGHLVAVNSNHHLFMFDTSVKIPSYINVDITDDPSALDNIVLVDGEMTDYMRQKLLKDYGVIKEEPVPNTFVPGNRTWQAQTYSNMLGISSVSTGSDMIIMQADINNTAGHTQGEAFLDLTIDNIGHTITNPYDLNGKTMSFYVKLQDGTIPTGGSLTVQAFAKDASWNTEYSTQITITQAGVWCKVDLDISTMTPIFGLKDPSFNPSQIRLVGLRIISTAANFTYNGQIYVKDANHQTIPAGEKVIDFPFFVNKNSIKPYVGAIPADQVTGNPNYISWADIPALFLANNNTGNNGQIDLNKGTWRAQNYAYSQGLETVTRDEANNQWILGLNLTAGDQIKNDGEMYIDLRYDIPGYTWSGPLDLTGKTLTFKVKAPAGFLAASNSASNPIWVQVFVKDENYDYQYGKNVQIIQEGQWITVTLTPQIGEIEEGNSKTSPNFDSTKIVNIGLKISCNKGSVLTYKGDFYVQNATSVDILNQATGVYLLDINALKNYAASKNLKLTYEESLGPQIRLAKQSLPTYFKDSSFNMATEYYPDGPIKSVLKGNSRVEYYKTDGKLIKITDKNDATLVEYKYDANGDLTEIDYSGTRDTIRKAMDDARMQAQQQADDTIKQIAEAKGYAIQYVSDTIQPALDTAYATRASLQAQWNNWNGRSYHWWQWGEKSQKKEAMHALENAIGQVDQTISSLLAKATEMYAQIDININKAKVDIQTQFNASLQAISVQENTAIAETLKQEVIEVTDTYYKEVLGRNVSSDEISGWITKAQVQGCLDPINRKAFDVSLVRTELYTNPIYIDEAASNNSFINDVNTATANFLASFRTMTDAQKTAALSALGLTDIKDICYSASDFDAILKYLLSNNKHFGKSAFTALAEIIKNNGKTVSAQDLKDLATKVILIDIFSGSITSITNGELKISMFALSKYAAIKYNITLYNTKLNNKDLAALQDAILGGKKAIVMVSGNHLVVVTSIAADGTVSYYESSKGASGENTTLSKKDFLDSWDGYAIIQKQPVNDSISKTLSAAEARLIRGSDPFTIFAIISVIFAIASTVLSFIDNEICQMLSKVFAIVSLVTGVLSIVSSFDKIIRGFATGIQNIGNTLELTTKSLTSLFTQGLKGFASGVAAVLSKAVSGICLNMSYNKALTTFGLNSDLAGITSAFLSGGFMGVDQTFSLTGGFTSLTMEGVRYAGRELGLDSTITGIIGMSAATIVSAGLGGVSYYDSKGILQPLKGLDAISYTIKTTVLPNVASELAYYGINQLGEMIGVDSIVSQLAGIGIRSTISAGFRGYNTNDIFQTAMGGLLQGVTSIGINYATEELGLNPLLANIGFSAIASSINAGIQAATGGSQDVFGSFFDTYMDNALTFLGYGDPGDPNYLWLEASYKANILDFSDIARQKGLVEALNTYGVSFFNSTAIGAIVQSGQTIGKYFSDKLQLVAPDQEVVDIPIIDKDGNVKGSAKFKRNTDDSWSLIGKEEGDIRIIGKPGKDSYGRLAFLDAEIYEDHGTYTLHQVIKDGQQIYAEMIDSQGKILLAIEPTQDGDYNYYNSYGEYVDAKIKDTFGMNFYLENGELKFSLLDVATDEMDSMPTYVFDPNKTNIENAINYTDSMFEDIGRVFTGDAIFGASSWEVAMKAIMLTSTKFNVKYGGELIGLTNTLSSEDKKSFQDCILLKYDSLLHSYDYFDIATEDELAIWAALKSPPGSQYGFALTAIHGMSPHEDGWADNLNDIKVNGQNFILTANSWNKKGSADYIEGDGLTEYWQGGDKRRYIIESAKQDIKTGWQQALAQGIPFDVALHSLGTVSGYEAIRELKSERPDIKIRNVYMMGSPLGFFIQNGKATYDSSAFSNVANVVNIYNKYDALNIVQTVALFALTDDPEIRDVLSNRLFGSKPVSGELKYLFSNIRDVSTTVPHGAMWKDPKILTIVEENGVFTN